MRKTKKTSFRYLAFGPRRAKILDACLLKAALFECNIRLLINKTHPNKSVNDGGRSVVRALVQTYRLGERETLLLHSALTMRDKLVHCEPDALRSEVMSRFPSFKPRTAAWQIDVRSVPEKSPVDVTTENSREVGFFGWLHQVSLDGTLPLVFKTLVEANSLVWELALRGPE